MMRDPTTSVRTVVVMGVSGSGKTAVGRELAACLGWRFRDADDFHPAANVERMSRGIALTDDDRGPWLDRLRDLVTDALAAGGEPTVLACSALARRYRGRMGLGRAGVRLVFLDGPREVIRERIAARRDHFMPASLLDSQLAALEPPCADERPIVASIEGTPAEIAAGIVAALDAV